MTDTAEHARRLDVDVDVDVDDVAVEHVVVVDHHGRPGGVVAKGDAHDERTPLHLAFSCHLVRADGSVLLTRRADTKSTWPGTWTNGCCGHPQLFETLRMAVNRRIEQELGLRAGHTTVAIADFAYRSVMPDGTIEHELCPVVLVSVEGEPDLDPSEVQAVEWVRWDALVERARSEPETLSPWCVEQVLQLVDLGVEPVDWLAANGHGGHDAVLDHPIELDPDAGEDARPGVLDARPSVGRRDDPIEAVTVPLTPLLESFLDDRSRELVTIDPELRAVAREVRQLVAAGGKRMRPAFVYWGHRASGLEHDAGVLRPAGAVELLHTFALLHDDVMDRSATRRGRPSAFVSFADHHARLGAAGDPERFGVNAAILAGDMAYVWADELFDSTELHADAVARARRVFTELRTEVIAGQYLDLHLSGATDASESGARRVAVLKSARYTVTRPLLLRAALATDSATDPEELTDALTRYGDAVGLAFQMRDDVLGVFGDPSVTGKGRVDDLREGKRTVLVLRAMRLADAAGRAALGAALGDPALDEQGAERCRDVIASSGALASVETLISRQHELAVQAIGRVDGPARTALEKLAASAVERWS